MSSYMTDVISYTRPHNFPAQIHQHQNTTTHYDPSIPHSQTTYPFATDTYDQASIISHALALLNPNRESCMNDEFADSHPNIRVESSTPLPPGGYDGRQDSVIPAYAPIPHDWQMYQTSMSTRRPLKRARSHQRTPSASTVASNGPASPYTATTSYPHVANTDFSPNSPIHYADQPAFFSKNLPTPQQTPTDATFMNAGYMTTNYTSDASSANWAMRGFPGNFSNSEDLPPEFLHSSRHSMSSGHDSPATPQSGVGEIGDSKNYNMNQNDFRQPNPNVQLFRTESSQAYSDELYNPQNFTSVPAAQGNNSAAKANHSAFLSPHRNIINERLQTANLARSSSPTSAVSRERSPFRDGSPLAPTGDWKPNRNAIGTAAGMRQQQREDAAQAEYAQHQPALQREPTKTISPKDALLDYSESEQPPLFQDNVPIGYRQHTSGSETWQNDFMNQPSATFGNLSAPANTQQQMPPYHATANDGFNEANLGYYSLPPAHPDQASQIQVTPFQPNSYAGQKMNYADATPEFPATLTSMESSVSEGGQFPSSQDNYNQATAQRPLDTRANTGTYTCTYHGCTQRFDSHINLQKHKRDYHRSQQNKDSPSTTGTESNNSPRSTESPAPSSSGMTSAAILARNSQAGPHKCTRINPSTNKPCNTIFSRPYDLTRHEDTIHNNRKQKVRCPMCREEKTFSRNDALTRHMRVVHPEVESFGKRSRRGD